MTIPTINQIIDAMDAAGLNAKESRDGESVVIGYGNAGYLRLIPSLIIISGKEIPAAEIRGKVSGKAHSDMRKALEAAGMGTR